MAVRARRRRDLPQDWQLARLLLLAPAPSTLPFPPSLLLPTPGHKSSEVAPVLAKICEAYGCK